MKSTNDFLNQENNNGLKNNEKYLLEKELGSEYKILNQLGKKGDRTTAYLVVASNNEKYALKIPNNLQDKKWIISQKKGYKIINEFITNMKSNILIPEVIKMGENFVLEKFGGENFTIAIYNKLNKKEQIEIAFNIAKFLNSNHQKKPSINKYTSKKPSIISYDEAIQYVRNFVNKKTFNHFENILERFNKIKPEEEIRSLTHKDIRSQNVLYNKETKRVSIIDFELAGISNIYDDFVPAASFNLSYELWFNVIDFYNEIEKDFDIKISKERVFLMHYINILHEYVRCAILNKTEKGTFANIMKNICLPKLYLLEKNFLDSEKKK